MALIWARGHAWRNDESINPLVITASEEWRSSDSGPKRVLHPYWAIDYAPQCDMTYRLNRASGPWIRREPGCFHLYAPETPYWEDTSNSGNYLSSSLLFRGGAELGMRRLLGETKGYAVLDDSSDTLAGLLHQMARIGHERGDSGFCQVQMMLWQVAEKLRDCEQTAENHYRLPAAIVDATEPKLADVIDSYLEKHLAERVTLTELARELHLSPSAISHRYKALRGRSPISSLIEMRIRSARMLLLKGYPLKTIAAQTGFRDAFHLSRTFRKSTGVSPKDFVKRTSGES